MDALSAREGDVEREVGRAAGAELAALEPGGHALGRIAIADAVGAGGDVGDLAVTHLDRERNRPFGRAIAMRGLAAAIEQTREPTGKGLMEHRDGVRGI